MPSCYFIYIFIYLLPCPSVGLEGRNLWQATSHRSMTDKCTSDKGWVGAEWVYVLPFTKLSVMKCGSPNTILLWMEIHKPHYNYKVYLWSRVILYSWGFWYILYWIIKWLWECHNHASIWFQLLVLANDVALNFLLYVRWPYSHKPIIHICISIIYTNHPLISLYKFIHTVAFSTSMSGWSVNCNDGVLLNEITERMSISGIRILCTFIHWN